MADSTSEEDFEEEVLLLALLVRRRRQRRQARKRKVWARNWILRRNALGAYAGLICELDVEDVEGFRQYHRLDRDAFREVLELVGNLITKEDSVMRPSISPSERLSVTLCFLATGKCSTIFLLTGLLILSQVYNNL